MRYALFTLVLATAALALPVSAQDRAATSSEGGSPFIEDDTSVLVQGSEGSIAASWADYDDDGDLDLLVTDVENGAFDDLYRNEGGGAFSLLAFQTNDDLAAVTNSSTWVDLDDDGDLDLVTSALNDGSVFINQGSQGGVPNFQYRRTKLDNFENQRSVDMADFDGDGRVDGVIMRSRAPLFGLSNILVRNAAGRGMVTVSSDVGMRRHDSVMGCWADVNNDRWPDLYVVNTGSDPNEFFLNVNGVMQVVTDQPILNVQGRSQSCSWGDYDNDGDLDLALTNYEGRDRLYRFDGGTAVLVGFEGSAATRTFGSAWGDVDNDGDLDLIVNRDGEAAMLFLNEGADTFTTVPIGDASDGYGIAATLVDDDEDGDLDLYLIYGGFNFFQQNHLYRNTTDGTGNWLEVDLRRASGGNRYGVGAHVYAYATVGGASRTMLRPVSARPGRGAQDGYRVHFGLGDATAVDSLVVDWPQGVDEEPTVLYGVAVNQIVTVGGGSAVVSTGEDLPQAGVSAPAAFAVEGAHPNPSRGALSLTVRSGSGEVIRVEVLDVLGRRVAALEAEGEAGASVPLFWDGTDAQGRPVGAGLYVLRVRQGAREQTAKVTLLR